MGLEGNVITDESLGYYNGRKGHFIVILDGYRWLGKYAKDKPEVYRYIVTMLRDEYQRVCDRRCCEIFSRHTAGSVGARP